LGWWWVAMDNCSCLTYKLSYCKKINSSIKVISSNAGSVGRRSASQSGRIITFSYLLLPEK
jgi:hypothetical protein